MKKLNAGAYVPIEKISKKARRELYKKQRGTWGAINPVTRKSPDPKAYKRKKIHSKDADEHDAVDFLVK